MGSHWLWRERQRRGADDSGEAAGAFPGAVQPSLVPPAQNAPTGFSESTAAASQAGRALHERAASRQSTDRRRAEVVAPGNVGLRFALGEAL
jgi:hypothetical protein